MMIVAVVVFFLLVTVQHVLAGGFIKNYKIVYYGMFESLKTEWISI